MNNMYDILAKMNLLEGRGSKPDFLDMDRDGNKTEPMKKAAADAKKKKDVAEGEHSQDAMRLNPDFKKVGAKPGIADKIRAGAKKVADFVAPGDEELIRRLEKSSGGKRPMDEADMEEGNRFTGNLMKARAAGKKQADLDGDGDMESVKEATKEIPGGRRHTSEPGGYGRKSDDDAPKAATKKGRGRPKKGSDSETGEVMKPDWSAFGVGKVNLPKHKGAVTKHKMVGEGEEADIEAAVKLLKKAGYTVTKGDAKLDEKAVSKSQRAAAGIAYAAKKGDVPKSELRGASKEMAKMPAGELKKFAKTKEKGLPEKKKKEVEETTVSGSVAAAPAAGGSKSKGGVQFGKGVYEAKLAESFAHQLKSVLNESMSVNLSVDTNGQKNLTVTATDEDADRLGQLLKLAGMESRGEGACNECGADGGMHETACSHRSQVEEELANSADNTQYADTDTLVNKLSGGLNGPKLQVNPNNKGDNPLAMPSLGKTAHTLNLGKVAESIKEETENRLWNLYKKY